jgi:hypothetical protein
LYFEAPAAQYVTATSPWLSPWREKMHMRAIELTASEWQSLIQLRGNADNGIPISHRAKLLLLGVVANKGGKLVVTFERRLQLREHGCKASGKK